ncbi:MAG TPA: TldD/PmbA family protein [Actinomycetota bacterium]|nr:TldD/PmbA family protein [Actinomycetota bacterium]
MQELVEGALQAALDAGATYADVRGQEIDIEDLSVRNGILETADRSLSAGVGIRVLVDGAWGFAATHDLRPGEAVRAARLAVGVGRASATVKRHNVVLVPAEPQRGAYATPIAEDPFGVSLAEKVDLLIAASLAMRIDPRITSAEASLALRREQTVFASSEGSLLHQAIVQTGCGISATAADEHDTQRRSYPGAHGGQHACAGYELVRGLALVEHAPGVAEEALALLAAPPCPEGVTTVVIDGSQVALQVHESVGHPTELDRVLGTEAAYAGTSFLSPPDLGRLVYGSPLVNIVSDGTSPGGLGTVGWDDEGVVPSPTHLIRDGLLVGFQTSRETAAAIGEERSNGTMRADGWISYPLIRMTNVNLLPGEGSLEELLAGVEDGLYLHTNRSWSIDDMRKNFQFGCEIAWEIKGGKLGRIVKNPMYQGITPEFWGSCDGIAGPAEWRIWGVPNCGKGQPGQTARVAHGAAPARFRNVAVRPGG